MNYRTGSMVLTLIFGLAGLAAIFQASEFPPAGNELGPAFFPTAIAVVMLAFCVIVLLRSFAAKPVKVDFDNKGAMAIALVITVLFLILWATFHKFFFLWVFLMACGMFFGFQGWKVRNIKLLSTGLGLGAGITLFVYIVFGMLIKLNF